ncbi:hypothetical protein RND81_04G229100 [Saponaria officinalis]|uniref:Protein kinase domain-containing protein n=1 Tax=Saponaria officinalis TaxID=3572 RepID=A0AAW1LNX8_SAPOF
MSLSKGQNITCPIKIVTQEEIEHATNSYDPQLIVARLHDAIVYKGTLNDRAVAIKTPKQLDLNPELVDLFLTELSVSMPFKWAGRLKGATDIAYALSYMHNALSKPLVHRDVKSFGILIDSSFHAKLVNVAYSVSINPGKKERRWPVYGTPGYIDLEYKETQELTDKCDVYSFGVLMLELLTGMNPFEMAKSGKDLVGEFVSQAERNGGIKEMIDVNVVEEEGHMEEIQRFARLALQCVAKKGDERPTMIGVVEELWRIQEGRNDQVIYTCVKRLYTYNQAIYTCISHLMFELIAWLYAYNRFTLD